MLVMNRVVLLKSLFFYLLSLLRTHIDFDEIKPVSCRAHVLPAAPPRCPCLPWVVHHKATHPNLPSQKRTPRATQHLPGWSQKQEFKREGRLLYISPEPRQTQGQPRQTLSPLGTWHGMASVYATNNPERYCICRMIPLGAKLSQEH